MAVAITTPEDPVNPAYDDVIRMIDSGGKSLTLVVVGKPAGMWQINTRWRYPWPRCKRKTKSRRRERGVMILS